VSDPHAIVTVNNEKAVVDPKGVFIASVDLPEGQSGIEIKVAAGGKEITETLSVTFERPLAIWMDSFKLDRTKDYTVEPLTVTGQVSDRKAQVSVNGIKAAVAVDGTYNAQIPLKMGIRGDMFEVNAIAELGGLVDVWSNSIIFWPGQQPFEAIRTLPPYTGGLSFIEPLVLHPGETAVLSPTLRAGKWEPEIVPVNWQLVRVSENDSAIQPALTGLSISLSPSHFTIYPNTAYQFYIKVEVSLEVAPGTYLFWLKGDNWMISPFGSSNLEIQIEV